MIEQIILNPPLPREHIVGLGAVLAVLAVLSYVRTRQGVGRIKRFLLTMFRLAVIAGLTIILLRPMAMKAQPASDVQSVFTVLVDTSQSMNTPDVDDKSRLQAVLTGIKGSEETFVRNLEQYYDVNFYTFSDTLNATTFEQLVYTKQAEGTSTDLASALINIGSPSPGRNKAGVLLISDGRENVGGEVGSAATYLKSMNVPVWTTAVGTETEAKDLYVTARLNQSFLFAGQEASFKVDISQTGYSDWYAKVDLLREDQPVGSQQVILKRGSQRVSFPIREEVKGTYQYTVKVEPLRGEADTTNNRRSVFVRVVDEQSKILLIEAQPYWDSKFLLRTLQADPNLDITSIFHINPRKSFGIIQRPSRLGPGQWVSPRNVRMPRTKKELFKYDCIILGKDIDTVFTVDELKLFKAYLEERGGSIVFARGKSYSFRNDILSQIEPVVWDEGGLANARFELTPAGLDNPMFDFGQSRGSTYVLRELPEMISISKVKKEKSLAVILARSKSDSAFEEIATISYQRYGKGKVMTIGTAGLWQWAFLPKDLDRYDDVFTRFWGQMIRWLVYGSDFLPGQDVTFRTDKVTYNLGETVPLVVQTKFVDPGEYRPRIVLTPPSGSPVQMFPEHEQDEQGYFSTIYLPGREGEYRASLYDGAGGTEQGTVRFTVYSDSVEKRFVASNKELMDQISDITSGEPLTMAQWRELPDMARDFELSAREESKPFDVWDTITVFSVLVGLLAVEWFVRRREGLV